ncbi:MAG TPA: energy transducer TonB [Rariglobus sp.]|jgi:colicin import membrane protein|nr:energy transducer TonB [Rariglobus sp.]
MSSVGVMNSRPPSAFFLSVILHGLVVALLLFLSYAMRDHTPPAPKIFELVAGAGDNYAATEAPALGSPTGIKFDMPESPVVAPSPAPEPAPAPIEPAPPEPSPVAPAPTPVKPANTVKPVPAPKPVDMAKLVTRITEKRAANIKKKIEKEKKVAEERAAKEAAIDAKRMTKAEFDRLNHTSTSSPKSGPIKVSKIDTAGIAGGVTGGSTSNKTGGAGGKALTREQMALSDAYISILIQRLREAHQKPDGLSDLLQTKVSFHLNQDGTMSDVKIISSSGNSDFDASVLAAFRRVRLPSPPANLKTDTYSVTFKMKEDE